MHHTSAHVVVRREGCINNGFWGIHTSARSNVISGASQPVPRLAVLRKEHNIQSLAPNYSLYNTSTYTGTAKPFRFDTFVRTRMHALPLNISSCALSSKCQTLDDFARLHRHTRSITLQVLVYGAVLRRRHRSTALLRARKARSFHARCCLRAPS